MVFTFGLKKIPVVTKLNHMLAKPIFQASRGNFEGLFQGKLKMIGIVRGSVSQGFEIDIKECSIWNLLALLDLVYSFFDECNNC